MWLRAVETLRRGFNGVRGGFGGPWSKSADRVAARRTIFCRNVRQSTDRIARTAMNVVICGYFVRSIMLCFTDRQWTATDRRLK